MFQEELFLNTHRLWALLQAPPGHIHAVATRPKDVARKRATTTSWFPPLPPGNKTFFTLKQQRGNQSRHDGSPLSSCNKPDTVKSSRTESRNQKMWLSKGTWKSPGGPRNGLENSVSAVGRSELLGLPHTQFIRSYGSSTLKMVVFSLV